MRLPEKGMEHTSGKLLTLGQGAVFSNPSLFHHRGKDVAACPRLEWIELQLPLQPQAQALKQWSFYTSVGEPPSGGQ